MVIDGITKYACALDLERVPGAGDIVFEGWEKKSKVPAGLLPNLGRADARNYYFDIMWGRLLRRVPRSGFSDGTTCRMLALYNGQERTLGDYIRVMECGGWKIKKIYSPDGRRISHVLAEAV